MSVHAQVRHYLQIVCVSRISVLELQNSRYCRFLHITRTPRVIWAESLPFMAISPHFVAFPVCTKRCSCTPLASQDMASPSTVPHLPPGKAQCRFSAVREPASSQLLEKQSSRTASAVKAGYSNMPFRSLQLYFARYNFRENFL